MVGEEGSRGEPRLRSEGTSPSSRHTPLSSLSPPGTGPILIISVGDLKTEDNILMVRYKKKLWEKSASLKSPRKESDPELDPDPDPIVRGTDLRILIWSPH